MLNRIILQGMIRERPLLGRNCYASRMERPPFKLRDASVKGEGLQPNVRADPRSMKAYVRLMGQPGFPDTIDGINQMLDRER